MWMPMLALLIVQILFAGLPVASKFVLAAANPLFVVVLRSAFATLLFWVVMRFVRSSGKERVMLGKEEHKRLWALAFFGITFNQMALFIALPHTSASVASIVSPSIAIFTLVFSVLAGREKFETLSISSVLLASVGVLFVLGSGRLGAETGRLPSEEGAFWANALNVISAASYAFYLARVGALPSRMGMIRFNFYFFLYGFILNMLAWGIVVALSAAGLIPLAQSLTLFVPWDDLRASFWWGLGFLLLGATAATYLLNTWALQRVRPSLVGGFVCLQTVFGLVFSGLILNETLTPLMMLGSILILGGVVLLSFAAWVKGSVGFAARDDSTSPV